MITSTPAALAGLATLALVGGAALTWAPSDAATGHRPPAQRTVPAKAATGPVTCVGGTAKGLVSKLSAEPFSFSGTTGNDVPVTGAQVNVKGPQRGTDTVLVTFSAESYYSGSGWMGIEVHKDGVPIAPFADNGSPLAFTSNSSYVSASAQFCTKVGRGTHVLTVEASTTGDATTDSGWLDDWTMSVQRYE